jgi:hypothetical protein
MTSTSKNGNHGLKKEKKSTGKAGNELFEISQKLGIALPAGLLLFCSMNASAMTRHSPVTQSAVIGTTGESLAGNEVILHLLSLKSGEHSMMLAAHDGPLHSDSHVDTNDPNVTNNYTDNGVHTNTHGNVHTNTHGDADRS